MDCLFRSLGKLGEVGLKDMAFNCSDCGVGAQFSARPQVMDGLCGPDSFILSPELGLKDGSYLED